MIKYLTNLDVAASQLRYRLPKLDLIHTTASLDSLRRELN
jgi:hypothetical protein